MTGPLALLGGTFDPVHNGHIGLADDVRRALGLSEVRLVPAGDPPHRGGPSASGRDRIAMLQLAVADHPELAVDAREVEREGKSYTVLTLEELRKEAPARPILLIVGADAFGVTAFPFITVVGADGTVLARWSGESAPDDFIAKLDAALATST